MKEPQGTAPPEASPDEFERRLDAFEAAWQEGPPPPIEKFLPSGPRRRGVLEELIRIDLEYRWRRGDVKPERPRLEDYVNRFPELGPAEQLPVALIGEEYRVRQRWGDRPGPAEYAARFTRHGPELRRALAEIDAELAEEAVRKGRPRAADMDPEPLSAASLRCPHCHHTIEIVPGPMPQSLACPSCGGAFSVEPFSAAGSPDAQPPRARIGRYELRGLLGTGAFGSVWRAWDSELEREVAVKLPRSGQFAGRAEEERFLREARSTAQLHHPGIVAVHDAGRDQDTLYIVSDLVRGQSLEQWLKGGRLSFAEAADLVARVAEALDYAHRQGVVHRDVKPANILLSLSREPPAGALAGGSRLNEAVPLITDFGLAKRDAGEITMTLDGQVLGTPAYMSPEQVRDPHAVDGRSDVYSLGVILYQLVAGELPFRGTARMLLLQVVSDEPRPPRWLNDQIPRDLETVCLKCLAKEPKRRYATAGALAADLRRWLAGEAVHAQPAGRLERLWRWLRRNPALVVAGGLGGVAVVAILGAPAAAFLVAVAAAAFLYALHQGKAALELTQVAQRLGQDQKKTAASLEMALRQCWVARQERDRALASAARVERRLAPARDLAHAFLFDLPERIEDLPSSTPARDFLVQTARAYLDRLGEVAGNEAPLLRELAAGRAKVGDIEQVLGRPAEALAAYRQALEVQKALVKADAKDGAARRGVVVCCNKIGNILKALGEVRAAMDSYREALGIVQALAEADPAAARAQRDLAVSCYKLGLAAALLGSDDQQPEDQRREHWREARTCYERSLDLVGDMSRRGILPASDAGIPDLLATEVARCNQALTALSGSGPAVPAPAANGANSVGPLPSAGKTKS